MANWADTAPDNTTSYLSVLQMLRDRDKDAASLCVAAPTNPFIGMMRFERSISVFQEWTGLAWQNKVLAIAGGGTGVTNLTDLRTALGLGTMSTQNNNAVNITGGTINAVTITNSVIGNSNSVDAGALQTGTVPLARISGITDTQVAAGAAIQWSKISKAGSSLADLAVRDASAINSGIFSTARLGAGTANSSTFLRGDGVWAAVPTGGGDPFTSGMVMMFDYGCPAGWTWLSGSNGRYLIGSNAWGTLGGRSVHGHNFEVWSDNGGDHNHHLDITRRSGNEIGSTYNLQSGSLPWYGTHQHDTRVDGDTQNAGTHNHRVAGSTGTEAIDPLSYSVVLCRKD